MTVADADPAEILPRPVKAVVTWCVALLVIAAAVYVLTRFLGQLSLLAFACAAALLLTALLQPWHQLLRRIGLPAALSAGIALLTLIATIALAITFVWNRAADQLDSLQENVAAGVEEVSDWLVDGPLSLRPEQIDQARDQVVGFVSGGNGGAAGVLAGARTVVDFMAGVVLALFLVFFLLKDGERIWGWILRLFRREQRLIIHGAAERAWNSLGHYVWGTVAVAVVDAVLIAVALWILQIPLVLPLAVLTFLAAFVPLIGATVAGAAAALVALVTQGPVPAVLVIGAVILVQQVEGNLLQPLIMRQALRIHPVPLVLAVSAGTLLAGIAGAVVAVPLLAVSYHVADHLVHAGSEPEPAEAPPEDEDT